MDDRGLEFAQVLEKSGIFLRIARTAQWYMNWHHATRQCSGHCDFASRWVSLGGLSSNIVQKFINWVEGVGRKYMHVR